MARSAVIICAAALCAFGCGASTVPTSPGTPTAVAPNVWVGSIAITSCTGNDFCLSGPQPFVLRLAADRSGWLQIDTNGVLHSGGEWSVHVTPTTVAGVTILKGSALGGQMPALGNIDVSFSMPQGDPANATIQYTLSRQSGPNDPRTTVVMMGRVAAVRADTSAFGGRFQGDWRGVPTWTSCSGDCELKYWLVGSDATSYSFSQNGAAVTGSSFTGTAVGNSLNGTVRYAITGPCKSGFDWDEVCASDGTISVTVDEFDQLHGTITLHLSGAGYTHAGPFDFTVTGTLDGLGRWIY